MFNAYLAGPFFNPEQIKIVDRIRQTLIDLKFDVYSPKDDCLYIPGKTDPKEVFELNCQQIVIADFIIAITDGKDPGTMWECGYAYAIQTPIVYVWLKHDGNQKFNLMLAQSGKAVCKSFADLIAVLTHYKSTSGKFLQFTHNSEIE